MVTEIMSLNTKRILLSRLYKETYTSWRIGSSLQLASILFSFFLFLLPMIHRLSFHIDCVSFD